MKHAVMLLLRQVRIHIFKHLPDDLLIDFLGLAQQLDFPFVLYHTDIINHPAV